jgi:hypothetical protein
MFKATKDQDAIEAVAQGVYDYVLDCWPTSFDAMEDLAEYTARRDGVLFGQRVA